MIQPELGIALMIFIVVAFLILAALIIFCIVFWILMLVDCVKRKFKEENEKVVWVLVIIFTHLIGAIIYYFIVKRSKSR